MKFNTYSLKARVLPTFLSIILPIIIFNHFYASEEFSKFISQTTSVKIISNIFISTIFLFFLSHIGRILGKNVFQKSYFKDELYVPTTNFLMLSNKQYSLNHKLKIRKKIKTDFNVILSSKEKEKSNETDARTKIVDVMSLIRKKLHNNKFLFQHNVEYGMMRNMIGGSILGCFFLSLI